MRRPNGSAKLTKSLTTLVSPDTILALDSLALRDQRTRSEVARRIIERVTPLILSEVKNKPRVYLLDLIDNIYLAPAVKTK
jgi:hypothetical protein